MGRATAKPRSADNDAGADDAAHDDAANNNDDAGGSDDRGGDNDDGLVSRIVEGVRGALLNDDDDANNNDDGNDDVSNNDAATPRTGRAQEESMYHRVRDALSDVRRDEQVEQRLAKVEHAVEKPPMKLRRLTRALWGDGQ